MVKWSIIEYCGLTENSSCGYCKNAGHKASLGTESGIVDPDEGDSVSFGVWAHSLSPDNYQALLDKGWRRSGKYIYKPTMEKTCCPQYTIRLDSTKFILSKSQRKVLRQMNEFLRNDVKPKVKVREEAPMDAHPASSSSTSEKKPHEKGDISLKKVDKTENPVQKKKEMRRQRCFDRWRAKGLNVEEMKKARAAKEEARRRTVESYILEPDEKWKHKLEVKLVRTNAPEFKERYDESYLLFEKYQRIIHKDDDSSKAGYKRFLVDTPLFDDEILRPSSSSYATGSYHQWYILDGHLIAVGVIDILPRCVSSKYMYYDPDYAFLSLGTYTALREIAFTREVMKHRPETRYYYMGYYISTCPKMRYKGKFRPSELLCDRSFQWVPLDECQRLLKANKDKFTIFRPNDSPAEMQTREQLLLLVDGKILPYADIADLAPSLKKVADLPAVKEKLDSFASRIGNDMNGLILFLSEFQDVDSD
ncbi:unnamed protein product [Cylicocyclus nassatus]|uniref:Arginyl-tRNA--protein transferase 1 n=1 Tax=Cylicocyclus nassatus TaxID=53992 RepID=A0AA36DRL4_CYLNA|nr:unnamed protein product [Cylicocyclus nassatus]